MAATAAQGERREPYIGEKRRFMRDGYGTYVYENAFFRYEGEWMKGKKHGHGKLLMKDGTYYEGQFVNGEINGHGYKFFASSEAKYTGQFLNGEMHGHGIMNYKNGNIYEGQWYKNKKQGFGILRTGERSVYEGSFQSHCREGEGTQTYDSTYKNLSNGDRFEGFWVMDQRHGHGELWCADGSHYVGQFLSDLFNGEGTMTHASGIVYQGMWIDGYPVTMATKLVLIVEEQPLIIRQGLPFSVRVECRNDNDEIVPEQGREIQVMAGFKYRTPKEGSALFDVIEDVEDKPIPTPFGYDVVPYPLTDQAFDVEVTMDAVDAKADGDGKLEEDGDEKGEEEGEEEGLEEMGELKEAIEDIANVPAEASADEKDGPQEGSRPASPEQQAQEAGVDEGAATTAAAADSKPEGVSALLPPAKTQPSLLGVCEWHTLQLAPPPPMYRPFVIMEEEAGQKKKSRIAQMREKMGEGEEEGEKAVSDVAEEWDEVEKSVADAETSADENRENEKVEAQDLKQKLTVSYVDETEVQDDSERKNSQLGGPAVKASQEPDKSTVSDEKVARTGEYILIVNDVTNPPFMGCRLEPAFLMLKLKRPKRVIVKKPKWDTQRHIAMAMSRSNSSYPDQ
ncbi:uncharacterized protein LOC101861022 isoform X3 [Aplysia californica]|uniref:Uncharacterized protein LOC101861022 isoform X3 n=1 Tax=Aplysia californica TaxID=6500 RepID=A0ABM0JEV1_APLCA|nr:uncharacterized protein LOC101861022 isoform X3 [Aplysia californica]